MVGKWGESDLSRCLLARRREAGIKTERGERLQLEEKNAETLTTLSMDTGVGKIAKRLGKTASTNSVERLGARIRVRP